MTRKYLPTIADLIDRLSISLMKSIFIDKGVYSAEANMIKSDLEVLLRGAVWTQASPSQLIYDVLVLMLANRYIWENEGDIRTTPMTEGKPDGYKDIALRLIATHSINGVRTRAKNEINRIFGERCDVKTDCLAANLPPQMGNWRVFD